MDKLSVALEGARILFTYVLFFNFSPVFFSFCFFVFPNEVLGMFFHLLQL